MLFEESKHLVIDNHIRCIGSVQYHPNDICELVHLRCQYSIGADRGLAQLKILINLIFEGIAFSERHKSGLAVRFPRILRWRKDKKVDEINELDDLKSMIRN